MTQKQLADVTGLDQSYISALEKHDRKRSPTLRTIELIAEALDVCPFKLMNCTCNPDCATCRKKFW